jgi:hypothetical protein
LLLTKYSHTECKLLIRNEFGSQIRFVKLIVGVEWFFLLLFCLFYCIMPAFKVRLRILWHQTAWFDIGLGLWCLTPLSEIFHLYRGSQFYWWRKLEYPEKTIDLPQVNWQTLLHNVVSRFELTTLVSSRY